MNHIDSFLFVRHGETDLNAEGLLQFQIDAPLNAKGRLQAKEAGKNLSKLNKSKFFILHSPYQRAYSTAVGIAHHLSQNSEHEIVGFEMHSGLKERFGGTLTPWKDLEQKAAQIFKNGENLWDNLKHFCPKAECSIPMVKRIEEALNYGYLSATAMDAQLLVVAHLGAFSSFGRHKLGQPDETLFKNATPYLFLNEYDEKGHWLIEELTGV